MVRECFVKCCFAINDKYGQCISVVKSFPDTFSNKIESMRNNIGVCYFAVCKHIYFAVINHVCYYLLMYKWTNQL